jgi:hypothetical protein
MFDLSQDTDTADALPQPEAVDSDRLEDALGEMLAQKQLLNKALCTLLGVFAVNTEVSSMIALGIGALASGTIASVVVGIFLSHALSKLNYLTFPVKSENPSRTPNQRFWRGASTLTSFGRGSRAGIRIPF